MTLVRTRKIIDEAGANAVLDAAERFALEKGHRVVMALVDPWGELVAFRRTPDAQVASSRVALDKARTAAIFIRPSREIEEQVSEGRLGALALNGAAALIGGIPLKVDGETVGAIGTSGETPDEDEAVSLAGVAAAELAVAEAPALTREGAQLAAEAIGAEANRRGVAPVISAVDAGGALMYLHCSDAAQVASVEVTTDKARTAAIYRRSSKDFEDQASTGRPSALHLARAVPLQGGEPIVFDGQVIGAVGVSGATSADEDRELALIGAAAVPAAASRDSNGAGAAFFPSARLEDGGLLADLPGYKLDAGLRTEPGEVEYHEHAVDVMHVVEGNATVLTGGEMIEPREVGPGELRAPSVEGAQAHELTPGDVLAIPNGVPHQFTSVSDPFRYFVVKVDA